MTFLRLTDKQVSELPPYQRLLYRIQEAADCLEKDTIFLKATSHYYSLYQNQYLEPALRNLNEVLSELKLWEKKE